MNKAKFNVKNVLLILALVCMFLFAGVFAACNDNPDNGDDGEDKRTLTITDARGIEVASAISIELQPKYQFTATVGGGKGEVLFSSSNKAVVDISNKGLATVKTVGTTTISAEIKDSEIKKEFTITIVEAQLLAQNVYKVAVDGGKDTTFVVKTSQANAGATIRLKVNQTFSDYYTLDNYGNAKIALSELGLQNTGIYDVGVVFPNNAGIAISSIGISDVMESYNFDTTEGWKLQTGSVTPGFKNQTLTVNDGWGAVSITVKLNNATKRYIRVSVKDGTAKWGIKLNSQSVYGTTDDLNLIDDRQAVAGEVVLADITQFVDRMVDESLKRGGDYTVTLKLFAASNNGAQTVSIDCIEIFGDDGEIREGVFESNYMPSGTLRIDTHSANVQVGKTHQIKLKGDISTFGFVFSSSDETVAVVDSNGIVTGIGSGTAKISVKSFDGTQSDEVEIYSYIAVEKFETTREVFSVAKADNSFDLSEEITVVPSNATNSTPVYSIVEGADIASISQEGVLTWSASGTVKVRLTTQDPLQKTKDITVRILDNYVEVTGMSLGDNANITVQVDQDFIITPTFLPADASDQAYTVEILTAGVFYEKPYSENGSLFVGWGNGKGVIRFRSMSNPDVYVDCNVTIHQDYVYKHDADGSTHLYFNFVRVDDKNLTDEQAIRPTDTIKLEFYNNGQLATTYTQEVGFPKNALVDKSNITGLVDGVTYTMRTQVLRGSNVVYGYWITNINETTFSQNLLDSSWGGTDNALFYPTNDGSIKVGYDGGPATFHTTFNYDKAQGGLLVVRVKLDSMGTYAFKMGTDPYVDTITFVPDGSDEGWLIFNLSELGANSGNYYLRFYLAQNGTIIVLSDLSYYSGYTALSKISF